MQKLHMYRGPDKRIDKLGVVRTQMIQYDESKDDLDCSLRDANIFT